MLTDIFRCIVSRHSALMGHIVNMQRKRPLSLGKRGKCARIVTIPAARRKHLAHKRPVSDADAR